MQVFTDLHLHSCLSPCAEDDMTPWNMVGMAKIKGLDVVAVTDHNAPFNLPDAMEAGKELGVAVIPGLEVTSKEEVHVLAYFYTLEDALAFGEVVYEHLPKVKNQSALFGRQIIISDGDVESGEAERLLISATDFGVDQLAELIEEYHGIAVPAHINRGNNGMIGALGLMPMLPQYPVVEVSPSAACPDYAKKGRFVLSSSDAHRLENISEREFFLEAEDKTVKAVLDVLAAEAKARG